MNQFVILKLVLDEPYLIQDVEPDQAKLLPGTAHAQLAEQHNPREATNESITRRGKGKAVSHVAHREQCQNISPLPRAVRKFGRGV